MLRNTESFPGKGMYRTGQCECVCACVCTSVNGAHDGAAATHSDEFN